MSAIAIGDQLSIDWYQIPSFGQAAKRVEVGTMTIHGRVPPLMLIIR